MENLILAFPHVRIFIMVAVLAFIVVGLANVVDCADAVITERIAGKPIESAKLRHAMWKLAKEWMLMLVVLMIDAMMATCWTQLPFLIIACAIAMVATEALSMVEHARLRKDKITKLPGALKDFVEYFGEDELKAMLKEVAKRKLLND